MKELLTIDIDCQILGMQNAELTATKAVNKFHDLAWYCGAQRMLKNQHKYKRIDVVLDGIRAADIEKKFPAETKQLKEGYEQKGMRWLEALENRLAWNHDGALNVLAQIRNDRLELEDESMRRVAT